MDRFGTSLVGAIFIAIFCSSVGWAQTITISDTEQQSNFNGYTQGNDPSHNTAPITTNPFNFTGQPQLSSITSISITLTMFDGDTDFGNNGTDDTPYPPDGVTHGDDDDFINTLHLHLNGIETAPVPSSGTAAPPSLLLNGFRNWDPNTPIPTGFISLTITGTPANIPALLGQLNSTGHLFAQVFDAGFTNTSNSSQNSFVIPSTQYQSSTPIFATLSITGVAIPEPRVAVLTFVGLGWLGLMSYRSATARSRKISQS